MPLLRFRAGLNEPPGSGNQHFALQFLFRFGLILFDAAAANQEFTFFLPVTRLPQLKARQ